MLFQQVSEKDILFWVPTHNDWDQLANVLSSIRNNFPKSRVVVYSDRDSLDASQHIANFFDVEVVQHSGIIHYGEWPRIRTLHQDWLNWFRSHSDCRWFLKIDTDALVRHPFRVLPTGCAFGTIQMTNDFPQGGCYGIDRVTVEQFLSHPPPTLEEVLKTDDLTRLKRNRFSEDRFIGWLFNRAGIRFCNWPGIQSLSVTPEKFTDSAFVIHPVQSFSVGKEISKDVVCDSFNDELISRYYQPLVDLLDSLPDFDWIPNSGNWGDAMIRTGTELFFSKLKLLPRLVEMPRAGHTLVYGGGGAWCRFFHHGRDICLKATNLYKQVIVLPSTYDGYFSSLPSNLILIARDDVSQKLVKSSLPTIPDMSWLLPKYKTEVKRDQLIAWRTNRDRHLNRPEPPSENTDISSTGNHLSQVEPLLKLVGSHRKVDTDRMHIGIAASIQGVKKLVLRPNGYHKVEAAFNSFPELYPKGTSLVPF